MVATNDDIVAELKKLNKKMLKVSKWINKTYPEDAELSKVDEE